MFYLGPTHIVPYCKAEKALGLFCKTDDSFALVLTRASVLYITRLSLYYMLKNYICEKGILDLSHKYTKD